MYLNVILVSFVLSVCMCSTHTFTYVDLELMVQQFKSIQNIDVEPWKSNIIQEVYPDLKAETNKDIQGTFTTAEVTHDSTLPRLHQGHNQDHLPCAICSIGRCIWLIMGL
jgi:hypothetical protein